MPNISEADLPLTKAEPISDGGSTSVITYLRRGKSFCTGAIAAREERICESKDSVDTKVSGKEGGGGAPCARAEIPLQPMVQPMVQTMLRQLCPYSSWRFTVEKRSTCSPRKTP
ncbi:protein pxr1-like [Pitangus sulphuratus]|nr:protein pxr1-like [Pitangus sulphuratus]